MSPESSDRAARFATLYKARYGAIHAYASRRVGVEAADEIAADTFLVAWRRFEALPSEPLPWLYGVARNIVMRHHSSRARQHAASAALVREPSNWAQSDLEDFGDSRLWEAWDQLRPTDREVLALVAWEELPVADAACALGCSAPVFSVRLHRARRRLERLLVAAECLPSPELSEA
jgi:RNA polymerase sigma-70 factor (ECF subfamily)